VIRVVGTVQGQQCHPRLHPSSLTAPLFDLGRQRNGLVEEWFSALANLIGVSAVEHDKRAIRWVSQSFKTS
jgi:hypothetical protein